MKFTRLGSFSPGELDEQDELADDGRLRCDGCDSPYANFGTVESPRVVEKDPAGEVVGRPPRPLAPGTPITTAPAPAAPEATR